MLLAHGRQVNIAPINNANPHSTASKHNMAAVNPIRRASGRELVRMQAAGTTAATNAEPIITLGIQVAYLWSKERWDRSKLTPATVTSAGKQKAVTPINRLFDKVDIRFRHLTLDDSGANFHAPRERSADGIRLNWKEAPPSSPKI